LFYKKIILFQILFNFPWNHSLNNLNQNRSALIKNTSMSTITITNIGALGVDAGTPILNPGEAAILAFGAVRPTPWVIDEQIVIRQVTHLALSFDHRLVDGQLGANVLTAIASVLTEPVQALLHAPSKQKCPPAPLNELEGPD